MKVFPFECAPKCSEKAFKVWLLITSKKLLEKNNFNHCRSYPLLSSLLFFFPNFILLYGYSSTCMHTRSPVHTDWLFPCNVQALLARCPRQMQSVFELDSGHPYEHPCYGQLTAVKKSICWPVSSCCIAGSIVQLIEMTCFFKAICWPAVSFNWLQAEVHNEKAIIIIINNLLTSSIQSLQGNLRPRPWCIDRVIHQGLSLRFPCNE